MNLLNQNLLCFHENNNFSFSSKLVNFSQLYFTNYSYGDKPAFLASYKDGIGKALIVLNIDGSGVEEIFLCDIKNLKNTDPNLFPEFLFNFYFSNYREGLTFENQLINYEVVPVYKHSENVIVPFESRIEITALDKRFHSIDTLISFDDFEKGIIQKIREMKSKHVVFDVCRILNSYRRLKLNLIDKTDYSDYTIHKW